MTFSNVSEQQETSMVPQHGTEKDGESCERKNREILRSLLVN